MGIEDYFNEMVKNNLWDGRVVGIPFLFAVIDMEENNLKSRELAEYTKTGLLFINN